MRGPKPGRSWVPSTLVASSDSYELEYILNHPNPGVIARNLGAFTPLHLAVQFQQDIPIKKLLEWAPCLGLDYVNARNHFVQTPLHFAAQKASTTVTELLLQYGADIEAVNTHGMLLCTMRQRTGWGIK